MLGVLLAVVEETELEKRIQICIIAKRDNMIKNILSAFRFDRKKRRLQ